MKEKLLTTVLLAGLASIPFSTVAAAKSGPVFARVADIGAGGGPARDAGAICKTTLGLNPANADYDACERTLLRYRPVLAADNRGSAVAAPKDWDLFPARNRSVFEESCAELGVDPATEAVVDCARNLDATLFEMNNSAAE